MMPAFKINKIFPKERLQNQITRFIENKLNFESVATYYQLANIFNLHNCAAISLKYIERCFTMVVESQSFSHLRFNLVEKILSSSELDITSEFQVLQAANTWIEYNYDERSKYAKELLLKVRLPLLSHHALRKVLNKPDNELYSYVFQRNKECRVIAKKILHNRENFYQNKSVKNYETRYCSQRKYNILIWESVDQNRNRNNERNIIQIDGENLKTIKSLTHLPKGSECCWMISIKHTLYLFFHSPYNNKKHVYKYSFITNAWKKLTTIHSNRDLISVCGFMDKAFLVGGRDKIGEACSSCIEFNTTNSKTNYIKSMNEARMSPATAVFEGRVVVSGGCVDVGGLAYNTVEAYDHVANMWSHMPDMIYGKYGHSLVAVRNKLFAFEGILHGQNEVFDSFSRKFSILKLPSSLNEYVLRTKCVSIGSNILIFKNNSATVTAFDFSKDEWTEEPCQVTKNIRVLYSLRLPKV